MTWKHLLSPLFVVAAWAAMAPDAAAYYHTQMGRFINRDPIEYAAGDPNLYRYVANRPTSAVDPAGLEGCSKTRPALLPKISNIMPAVVTDAFGKPCVSNCAVAHTYCRKAGIDEDDCMEMYDQCRAYCVAKEKFGTQVGEGWEKTWTDELSAIGGIAMIGGGAALVRHGASAYLKAAGIGVGAAGILLEVYHVPHVIHGQYDRLNNAAIVGWFNRTATELSNNKRVNTTFFTGIYGTGVFQPGAIPGTGPLGSASGFWITPCETPDTVFIHWKDKDGQWHLAESEGHQGVDKEGCMYLDEIVRINMWMASESAKAAK